MRPNSRILRALERPLKVSPTLRKVLAVSHGKEYSQQREEHFSDARKGNVTSVDGARITYYEYGPADAECTIVFIHGYTLAAVAWYQQVDYMREHFPNVRLVLVDLRGHGNSEDVSIDRCSIELAADDVVAVMEERVTSGKVVLVGHSLGGPVSLAVVRRLPADVREHLVGLVEVSTSIDKIAQAGLARILNTRLMKRVIEGYRRQPTALSQTKALVRGIIPHFLSVGVFMRDIDDKNIEFHASLIAEAPPETLIGFLDDFQYHEELEAAALLEGVPGYIICGDKDQVTPLSQSEHLMELWPDAYLQVAHNAGHMLPLEVPNIVNLALRGILVENEIVEAHAGA